MPQTQCNADSEQNSQMVTIAPGEANSRFQRIIKASSSEVGEYPNLENAINDLLSGSRKDVSTEPSCKGVDSDKNQYALFDERLKSARVVLGSPPPPEPPCLSVAGIEVATPGNLSGIIAQPGSGKSSFLAAGIASIVTKEPQRDFLGWSAQNVKGAVLHLDTEQSAGDHYKMFQRILKRANVENAPDWLISYHLAGWQPFELVGALNQTLVAAKKEHGSIHSVWLDGTADLVASVNDEAQSTSFVVELHKLAMEFQTHIVNVLHHNPGTNKARGHLGSHLERKAQTFLELTMKNGITSVKSTKKRGKPIEAPDGVSFKWDPDEGMHMLTGNDFEKTASEKYEAKLKDLRDLAYEALQKNMSLPRGQFILRIAECLGKSESTGKRQFNEMKRLGIIGPSDSGTYRFINSNKPKNDE